MASSKTFEDLDLSREEIKRIETALKDEKFRKMFVEYAEEISNPENRKLYEEEIAMMERERGMDVQFVNPKPGHVMKTVDDSGKKVFINVCTSDKIGTPSSTKQTDVAGNRGLHWQIPHSFSPPREDTDKAKETCMVYDVVFHPDTYRMASNPRFKKLIEDTALDGVEKQFACRIDRNNIKRPKIQYKGHPVATVIRSRKDNGDASHVMEPNDPLQNMPYPYENKTSAQLAEEKLKQAEKMAKDRKTKEDKTKLNTQKKGEDGFTIPKYTITHRSNLELQEFTNAPDSKPTTRPKELVINIQLPLCKSAAGVDLDIFEDKLSLKSEKPAYKLELTLPYPVEDDNGSAKFDKSKKCLVVTLPVVAIEVPKIPSFIDEIDSKEAEVTPLIEELPPLEEVNGVEEDLTTAEKLQEEREHNVTEKEVNQVSHLAGSISYSIPPYDYNQDLETVTFIFHVKNVSEESVSKSYPVPGSSEIKFASVGSGGFPWHYALHVKFEEGDEVVPEHSSVDVSDKNITWTLLKSCHSRKLWNRFSAGLDGQSLEDKLFLTTDNLSLQLEDLKVDGEAMVHTEEPSDVDRPRVEVTQMNHKKLTIKIGKPKVGFSEEEEEEISDDNCPSSADIEVVYSRAPPNIQGILKQRSISESSEDPSSSSTSESPSSTSPRDPDMLKHVRFNSHIDKTTYKTNMSVSSMKQALKSKRRRNRKREEKRADKATRRRHNSNGSEGSSCDELEQKLSGESHSEDDHDMEELAEQIEATGIKVEGYGVIEEAGEEVGESDEKKEVIETSTAEVAKASESENNKQSGDEKHSEGKGKNVSKKGNIAEQVKNKLSEEKCDVAVDSDDDNVDEFRTRGSSSKSAGKSDENAQKVVDRTSYPYGIADGAGVDLGVTGEDNQDNMAAAGLDLAHTGHSGKFGAIIGEGQNPPTDELKISQIVEEVKEEDGIHEKNPGESEGVNGEKEKTAGESAVKTDLSWKEANRVDPYNEHRTECAFKFSNAVMFDLDID